MNHSPLRIFGHRGAAGEAPENTVASFLQAVAEGADGIELDVQLTADGELVVVHDRSLDRLAADPREVERCTGAELAEIALSDSRDELAAGGPWRLPRLTEVFREIPPGFMVNVELKRYAAGVDALAGRAAALLAERPNVLVSSFDAELLRRLRRRAPALALAPLAERGTREILEVALELGAVAIHVGRLGIEREFAAAAGAARLPLHAYTVNTVGEAMRLTALGVTGVFTDYPGWLRRELASAAG